MPELSSTFITFPRRTRLRLTGPDAVRFLNGQISNDVTKLNKTIALPACVCQLKGKVEALIWMAQDDEGGILVDGDWSQREALLTRLDRYLIADDCEWSDESDDAALIHLPSRDAVPKELAQYPWRSTRRFRDSGIDLWLAQGSLSKAREVINDLGLEEITPDSGESWQLFNAEQAHPLPGREITGEALPAELGLDGWAVDFHKGCYLGQEVISRVESVGGVKKKAVIVVTEEEISDQKQEISVSGTIKKIIPISLLTSHRGKTRTLCWGAPAAKAYEQWDLTQK